MTEQKVAPKVTLELVDGGIQVEGNLAPLQTVLFLNEAIGAVTRDILASAQKEVPGDLPDANTSK